MSDHYGTAPYVSFSIVLLLQCTLGIWINKHDHCHFCQTLQN